MHQKLEGQIKSYDKVKKYGFIETDKGDTFYFSYNRADKTQSRREGVISKVSVLHLGDVVNFSLRESSYDNTKQEAYNIEYIGNPIREKIVDEANKSGFLRGYLKLINGDYFVKHTSTHVLIPVLISKWEVDLDLSYKTKDNELVEFQLVQPLKIHKLKAALIDVKYSNEYHYLVDKISSQEIIEADISGRNKDGFFATILNCKVNGFISFRQKDILEGKIKNIRFKNGDKVHVKVMRVANNGYVSLDFAEF